ncbi:MAG TPA: hypothetical protein VHC69_30540 [Polyangiaceae bacterium]|nr:hypothetical protein [Polyangiaceae bacterium]
MLTRSAALSSAVLSLLLAACAGENPAAPAQRFLAPVSGPGPWLSDDASSVSVRVSNQSERVACAEKDNVSILFQAPDVRRFTIEAAQPRYIGQLKRDNREPDWSGCDMHDDPVVPAEPREVVLYESAKLKLVAYTYAKFWRKNDVPFTVGNRVERGLHLVQLWVTDQGQSQELMVVYPPDGYFRVHPLPPPNLNGSDYGSSFLVGPIETEAGRLVVNLTGITFDPDERRFHLQYADGSMATLTVRGADGDRTVLDVDLGRRPGSARPFAALRSMYVTDLNADAARISVKEPAARSWREENILTFAGASATDVWMGRVVPSHHNTSAPDMVFHRFER